MSGRNVPAGWAAFRALRQTPTRHRPKRHGNWKYGGRSRLGRQQMRETRLLLRVLDVLDGRSAQTISPGALAWLSPPRPIGWGWYRIRRADPVDAA